MNVEECIQQYPTRLGRYRSKGVGHTIVLCKVACFLRTEALRQSITAAYNRLRPEEHRGRFEQEGEDNPGIG